MPIPALNKLPPFPTFDDLVTKVNSLVGELTNTLLNLDSLNVVDLTADHITAGTIDASVVSIRSELMAGAFVQIDGNGLVINNGLYDTFKADINGAVTMTSALIQSATGYPRVVMDPATTLFGAYNTPDDYVFIEANYGGAPAFRFVTAGEQRALINTLLGSLEIYGDQGIEISSATWVSIRGNTTFSNDVNVPSWSQVHNVASSQTLQEAFNTKAQKGVQTDSNGAHDHGISIGTRLAVTDASGVVVGFVPWEAVGNHTHTQK